MVILNFLMSVHDIFYALPFSVYGLIEKLQPFFPKDIVFFMDTVQPHTELIDAYSLFEKAVEKGVNSYYLISKKHPSYKEIKKKYKNRILEFDRNELHLKQFFKFLRLKKFINSFGFGGNLRLFLYKNKYIDLVHLNHGVTLLKNSIFDLYNYKEFNKFLVSNDIEAKLMMDYGGFKEENLVKSTMPHFDLLNENKTKTDEKNILMFFTWRMSFANVDYKKSLYYQNMKLLLENQEFNKILNENNIKLKLALHHTLIEKGTNFVLDNADFANSTQLSKEIKNAKMLITDYSSVWADFYFQNKPVIFYRLDNEDPVLNERDNQNSRFASKWDNVLTNVVYDEQKVLEIVKRYVECDFQIDERERQIQDKFFYVKENVREKILESEGLI